MKRQKASGLSVDDFDVAAYLAEGRASMGIVWSAWAMSLTRIQAAQANKDRQTLKCDKMFGGSIPAIDNKSGHPKSGVRPELGVWLLAIPKTSAMQEEAEKFIEYATSYEQMLIAAIEGNPPPRRSVLTIPEQHKKLKPQDDGSAILEKRNVPAHDHDHLGFHDPINCVANPAGVHERECETEVIQMIVEEYGELFTSQLHSLEIARPRPRTPCWTTLEDILSHHLQNLIVAEDGQALNIEKEIKDAKNEAQDPIKSCPALGPPQNIY